MRYNARYLLKMSMGEFFDREDEIDYQDSLIGLPTNDELKNSPNVRLVDSYTDENGQSYPARWESLLPTPAETMANMENLIPQSARKPIDNDFTQLDNFTQEQIAKLKNNQETPQTQLDEDDTEDVDLDNNIQNIIDSQSIQETPMPNFDVNTNTQNPLSELLSGLTQGLSALNTGDTANIPNMPTESILDKSVNSDAGKMYLVDKNQPRVLNYLSEPTVDEKHQQQETTEQTEQTEQPQVSANLTDYINDLVGENIDYGFIGNEASTSTQPEIPIYPENGVIKGGIANDSSQNNNDKTIGDNFKKWLFTNKVTEKILPMASHSVKDGLNDMEAAKQNPNATVYNSINDLEDKSLTEKFKKLETDENIKGVVYNSNSKEAQKITKSKELNDYVDEVINNGGVPQTNTLEFKQKENIFSPDNDLHYSLQNVTVHEPKISEDGKTFTCKIIDVSDFKERPKTVQNIPNNWGYKMQEKGHYQNYFEVIEIEVPLTDEQKELLKKRKRF